MDVLKNLGLNIEIKEILINDSFEKEYLIQKVSIKNIECIMLSPKHKLKSIKEAEKVVSRIYKIYHLPSFIKLNEISNFKRDHLLANNIPFIYLNKLVYLPFMACVLTNEQFNQRRINQTLTVSSELLLLWLLYQDGDRFYLNNAASHLNFSNMTITRAYRQLIATNLFSEHKDGRKIYLTSEFSKKALFVKMKNYLRNPIIKTVYLEETRLNKDMHLSGISLLNKIAKLNIETIKTYAIDVKLSENLDYSLSCDNLNSPIRLDIWEYNPIILARYSDIIDPLSLIITLIDSNDKDVKKALDTILNMM